MFNWIFKASCPCDSAAKTWIEERLHWLADEFEDSAFSGRRVILPTPQFFPDPYDGSENAVEALLERVCYYMDVNSNRVELHFINTSSSTYLVNESGQAVSGGAAGTYEDSGYHFIVSIDKSQLHHPMELVGTIAHELAHVRLMGEGRMTGDEFDNELLTDLTVVHFGMGLFLANCPRNWDGNYTRWPGTTLLKPEYMSAPMYGWALAHLALFRGEENPGWAKHLKSSPRTNLKQGLQYLRKSNDTSYFP